MADWVTAAVAGITALAGIGGNAVQGIFSRNSQHRTEGRDDAALLRNKFEELCNQVEDWAYKVGQMRIGLVRVLDGRSGATTPLPKAINLGALRSAAGLYFPELIKPLEEFDAAVAANAAQTERDNAIDPLMVVAAMMLRHLGLQDQLFLAFREQSKAIGARIGHRVR